MFSVNCNMAFREKTRERQTGKWPYPVSFLKYNNRVKESHYRPGQAQRVPEVKFP